MDDMDQPNILLNPLPEVQKAFCLFCFDSQLRIGSLKEITDVIAGDRSADINMYQMQPGKLVVKRYLETLPMAGKPNDIVEAFLVNPNTLTYDEIAFSPAATPKSTLNYWVPPSVAPIQGDCSVIGKFLLKVICNNDRNLSKYLLKFLAHMWQKPMEKPGVMIVLLGGQGTGKGTFFNLLQHIWLRTTLQVSAIEHVVSGFNAAMERNYIINMDEALFSGDKKSMDRLKSMITEPTIAIEQKNQPRRTIQSLHRFFAASNHDHFGNIEMDDRRFVCLRISEKYKRDSNYFDKIYAAMDDPVQLGAFVHFIANMDITNFNFRAKPDTSELLEQKLQSLGGFARYWYEVLCRGDIRNTNEFELTNEWNDARFVSSTDLIKYYSRHRSMSRHYQAVQSTEIKKGLNRYCPSAIKVRHLVGTNQQRGYQLPSLYKARVAFEQVIGSKIDWGEDNTEMLP